MDQRLSQLSPRVETSIKECYEDLIRAENGGTYKGNQSEYIQKGMKLQMSLRIMEDPSIVQDLEDFSVDEYLIETLEEYGELLGFDSDFEEDIYEVLDLAQDERFDDAWDYIGENYSGSEPEHYVLGGLVNAERSISFNMLG